MKTYKPDNSRLMRMKELYDLKFAEIKCQMDKMQEAIEKLNSIINNK